MQVINMTLNSRKQQCCVRRNHDLTVDNAGASECCTVPWHLQRTATAAGLPEHVTPAAALP
jgi:hypothetical protein